MSGYQAASIIEEKSKRIIVPIIEEQSNGRYILTQKGTLGKELQKIYGDVIFNDKKDGRMYVVEMKAEDDGSKNFFLEFWSNKARRTTGWMFHLKCDILLYHFLQPDELYILPFKRLVKGFFYGLHGRQPYYRRFKEVKQGKYVQMNDTWGILTPIDVVDQEFGGIKKINPCGLFGMNDDGQRRKSNYSGS